MNPQAKDLIEFLNAKHEKNCWFVYDTFKVYVRKAMRTLPPMRAFFDTLDIATINVYEEHQGNGIFTAYLTMAEDLAKEADRIVFIENVLNPRLAQWLECRGYSRMGPPELPSYFLISGRV